LIRKDQNLRGLHEALLLDKLAGGVRRRTRPLEGLKKWSALVLLHGCSTPPRGFTPRSMSLHGPEGREGSA
jgi:hypothetical protein